MEATRARWTGRDLSARDQSGIDQVMKDSPLDPCGDAYGSHQHRHQRVLQHRTTSALRQSFSVFAAWDEAGIH